MRKTLILLGALTAVYLSFTAAEAQVCSITDPCWDREYDQEVCDLCHVNNAELYQQCGTHDFCVEDYLEEFDRCEEEFCGGGGGDGHLT